MSLHKATIFVAPSTDSLAAQLAQKVVAIADKCIQERGVFTIALSGGSLASLLASVAETGHSSFDAWHVILADERCVPSDHEDSNYGGLRKSFLDKVGIPAGNIYPINESLVGGSAEAIAIDYEQVVDKMIKKSDNKLDLAVLGFGPDGHTCSLFPGHALLKETSRLVAFIEDSPKLPPQRVTLTFKVLNSMTRHVIFCGAGSSKTPILDKVFVDYKQDAASGSVQEYTAAYADPPPFPCAMVQPGSPVMWIVDEQAMGSLAQQRSEL
jgi:6-phosphogluconolactonase